MRRRMMMQIKRASKTLRNPDDFFVIDGGVNYFQTNFWVERDTSRPRRRRGIYSIVPTAKPCRTNGDVEFVPYPIEIPVNCSKIKSVTWNIQGLQCIVFAAIWGETNWSTTTATINTGWQQNIENIDLDGSTHFMLMFRVDDNNSDFNSSTTPTSVIVEFE